jgi:hypothetical protein
MSSLQKAGNKAPQVREKVFYRKIILANKFSNFQNINEPKLVDQEPKTIISKKKDDNY